MSEDCPKGIKSCDECPKVWKCIEESEFEEDDKSWKVKKSLKNRHNLR